MGYYVEIDKTDEKGKPLGSVHVGEVGLLHAVKEVEESLNKCGTNLLCCNPFPLSVLKGQTLENWILDAMDTVGVGQEKSLTFTIKVTLKVGQYDQSK